MLTMRLAVSTAERPKDGRIYPCLEEESERRQRLSQFCLSLRKFENPGDLENLRSPGSFIDMYEDT